MAERIEVPAHILEAVKPQKVQKNFGHRSWMPGSSPNSEGMLQAAIFFGIVPEGTQSLQGQSQWNQTIDALDKHAPNWRGYPAPTANPSLICK